MTHIETQDRQRERLPDKAQINAIADINALELLKEDIQKRIARIETDLDFRDATADWEERAIKALSIHRYTERVVSSRIEKLKGKQEAKASGTRPERTECHELTWKLLDGEFDNPEAESLEDIENEISVLDEAMEAAEIDKADELSKHEFRRDIVWITQINLALKKGKATKHQLTLKRSALKRADKEARLAQKEALRERMFIDACREMLPRETYAALWDRVDRKAIEAV